MDEIKLPEQDALLAEMKQLRDDARRYRDEARRLRTETKHMMLTAQMEAVYMPAEKEKWVLDGIPTPPGLYAYYGAGGDSYLLYHRDSGRGEYNGYLQALESAGFTCHNAGEVGKLAWACYYNDRAVVNVSHASSDGVLRVVVDHRGATELPPLEPICDGTPDSAESRLVLFGDHLYELHDCGMGYIFRLSDGTFVIIDGGMPTPETLPACFFERLRELAGDGPIVISAWIFTHAHPDHTRVFVRLTEMFPGQFEVRRVIHNFPGMLMQLGGGHRGWCKTEVRLVEEAMERLDPKPAFIRAHTGQRFEFPGLSVDMLFTLDDFKQPFFPDNFNATSLVFRVTAEGQTFMFLGDTDPTGCGILVERFGELLRSDVVQVAHHGYWGGTKEVYDAIRPAIVLWPCPLFDPRPERNFDPRLSNPAFSPITREMIRNYARAVYVQWKGTDILPLPLTGEEGDTLAAEDDPTI